MAIYELLKINFMKDCFSPCLLSAVNPLIFYFCCKDSRDRLWNVWQNSRLREVVCKKEEVHSGSDPRLKIVIKDVVFGEGAHISDADSSKFTLKLKPPPPPPARVRRPGCGVIKNRAFVSSPF
jgi:hypothetical protein